MLAKIILDNFKSFKHFEFDLNANESKKKAKNLAMIYGENSIGKTTLIDSLYLLSKTLFAIENSKILSPKEVAASLKPLKNLMFNDSLDYRLSDFINNYKRLGSRDNMVTQYIFYIDNNKYTYKMEFSEQSIIEESLLINGDIIFKVNKSNKKPFLSDKHFESTLFAHLINEYYSMYYGDYTLLACINSVLGNINQDYTKRRVSSSFEDFRKEVVSMIVYKNINGDSPSFVTVDNDILPNLVSSLYIDSMEPTLKKTQLALTMFFSSIYPNIESVEYDIQTDSNGLRKYDIVFVEKRNQDIVRSNYYLSSTGTKKLLHLFPYFYLLASSDRIVVVDEIDSGINDILLQTIINSFDEKIKGQFIMTTHNTLLLKNVNKRFIYVLDRDDNNEVISYSLDVFGRAIQPGTDILGRYIKGLYGGVPEAGSFSMNYIYEEVKRYGK